MKRFTDTAKWNDPWFRKLKPRQKCLWYYLLDQCDHAGVIDIDLEAAEFMIGEKISMADVGALGERVFTLPSGKLLITKFIEFQYGRLSQDCKPHQPVFLAITRHGVSLEDIQRLSKGTPKAIEGFPIGSQCVLDKEEEKEKVQEKEKDKSAEIPEPLKNDPEFVEAWGMWLSHLKQKRKPATKLAQEMQLEKLAQMGAETAIETIKHCIGHNWQSIFPINENNSRNNPASRRPLTGAEQRQVGTEGVPQYDIESMLRAKAERARKEANAPS